MVWETTSTPFGTTQAVALHPWPISNHSQILPSGASSPYSLMVNGTPSYAQVPGYELSSPSHAAVLCIPWLKLFNYTTWFSEWRANFTWNESYCEKNQSRTLKPFFFLYTTPPFILITTFCGIQYPFKYTKREMFLAVSLQEPGRLSQDPSCMHHTLQFIRRFIPKNWSGLHRSDSSRSTPQRSSFLITSVWQCLLVTSWSVETSDKEVFACFWGFAG